MKCINDGCNQEAVDYLEPLRVVADGDSRGGMRLIDPPPRFCSYRCWQEARPVEFLDLFGEEAA